MNNLWILRMQVVECIEKLISPGQYLIDWKRSLLDRQHASKVLAVDELHHQKLSLTLREVIANARKCGMVHAGKQPRLSLKLLPQALVGKEGFLQRHRCIKAFINRLVNRAHSSLAEL